MRKALDVLWLCCFLALHVGAQDDVNIPVDPTDYFTGTGTGTGFEEPPGDGDEGDEDDGEDPECKLKCPVWGTSVCAKNGLGEVCTFFDECYMHDFNCKEHTDYKVVDDEVCLNPWDHGEGPYSTQDVPSTTVAV